MGFGSQLCWTLSKLPCKAKSGERGCKSIPSYLILHKVILVYQLQIDGKMDSALLLVSTRRYLIYAQQKHSWLCLILQQCTFNVTLAYLTFEECSHLESTRHLLSNLRVNYLSMKVVWLNSHFLVSWLDIFADTAYSTQRASFTQQAFSLPFEFFTIHLYDDEYPHSESYLRIITWGFWWSQCNEIRFNCAWIFPQFPHHNCAY